MSHYNSIVIGSGQGGTPLATALAKAGRKTALIERTHIGGCCVNEGCTPTKTMVASARVAYLTRRSADYGVHTGSVKIDMEKVRQRKRDIVNQFRSGSEKRLQSTENLDVIFGEARFIDVKTIEVRYSSGETTTITGECIFINTGARPAVPEIKGLENVPYLDSTSIMELDHVPDHLISIGGGYISLEFSQMFLRFGSKVTIVQRGSQLLPREDIDVAQEVSSVLQEDGINLLLETKPIEVKKTNAGITLTVQGPNGTLELNGSHLLLATGRVPNSDVLNLSATEIQTDKNGFIIVNDRLETNVHGIFALGDVKGGPSFTHISYDDYRVITRNLLEKGNATITGRLVPYTLFIDPHLGRVGLTEKEAKQQNKKIRIAKMPMSYVARALEMDETRGSMKIIVDADSSQILGCSIFGIEGGEIMSIIQTAMVGKLPYKTLQEGVFAHPLLAESLNNVFLHFTDSTSGA
jgi:pyruvate/2-oxoglutarate dehydrogenase complex dihydrolipoamide dehydrogenase (E3) component